MSWPPTLVGSLVGLKGTAEYTWTCSYCHNTAGQRVEFNIYEDVPWPSVPTGWVVVPGVGSYCAKHRVTYKIEEAPDAA